MICTRCLRLRLLPTSSSTSRLTYSTSTSRTPPPPATSTSAAQPFSTPFTPSPYPANSPTHPPKHAPSSIKSSVQQQQPVSSLKAGTVLKGLGFEKNKEPPVAREDWEYPDWLWGLLGQGKEEGGKGGGGGDAFCKWTFSRCAWWRVWRRVARWDRFRFMGSTNVPSYIASEGSAEADMWVIE